MIPELDKLAESMCLDMVAVRAPVSRKRRTGQNHIKVYDTTAQPDRLVLIFEASNYDRKVWPR